MARLKIWMTAALSATFLATAATGSYAYSRRLNAFTMEAVWQPTQPIQGNFGSVAVDVDGSVFAVRIFDSWEQGGSELLLEKFDRAGLRLWSSVLPGTDPATLLGGEVVVGLRGVTVVREPVLPNGSIATSYSRAGRKISDSPILPSNLFGRVTIRSGANIWIATCGSAGSIEVLDQTLSVVGSFPTAGCVGDMAPRPGGGIIAVGTDGTTKAWVRAFDASGKELWGRPLAKGQPARGTVVVVSGTGATTVAKVKDETKVQYLERFSLAGIPIHSETARVVNRSILSGVALDNDHVLLGATNYDDTIFLRLDEDGRQIARSTKVPGAASQMVRDGDRIVVAGVGEHGMQAYKVPK